MFHVALLTKKHMEQLNEQPIESVQSSKNIWITIIAVIVTALVVGGGVYAWQRSNLKSTEQGLQQQITLLQDQISQLQKTQSNQNLPSVNQNQQQDNNIDEPTQPPTDKQQSDNTKPYSSHRYGLSFDYPNNFYLLDDPAKWNAILISEAPINFPDIGGTSAPLSIGSLDNQTLNAELNSLESKTESVITIDSVRARRIEGIAANVYDKSIKSKLLLVVIESKNIVVRGFESPIDRKINFDLETVFDQMVNSIEFN